ncbi:ArsA family ATPase [Thermocoleostomius sinensis]|uniref:TRC40/GET3/ArsA family transport-energizing ATPase n=1 Tax=Thermocoleostomius sinensis A174 TaxID=2016057 RepID=A0A9E8Z819_9CYAN|nr:TRC40/GET3/ArsA family transport-energizing ATPase [Thermocoleostomius sinensis A174]
MLPVKSFPTPPMFLTPSFQPPKLSMFSGKGGVGKTTLACAWARYWAQTFPHDRVLLLSTDPAHSLSDVLQRSISHIASSDTKLPNLAVQILDAAVLLQTFRSSYGEVLQQLVERGSFMAGSDLAPVWEFGFPGLDELMSLLEIQRLLRDQQADRIVVDMAPSGHTLNLFRMMDFLDNFLAALSLFQEKHRTVSRSFTGQVTDDEADYFLQRLSAELNAGRQLLQDPQRTSCYIVTIAEPMSYWETCRFLTALNDLCIPCGGLWINQITSQTNSFHKNWIDRFFEIAKKTPVYTIPWQMQEPIGADPIDRLVTQIEKLDDDISTTVKTPQLHQIKPVEFPARIPPSLSDLIADGRRLVIVGGKGGVGKTTISAAIGWAMSIRHSNCQIRVISIDPAHSLGDALGCQLGHDAMNLTANLSAQEVNGHQLLDRFRKDYLWELAAMMSGQTNDTELQLAYGPEAWQKMVSQALPGVDEILSLLTVIELLEQGKQDLIILDTAPTGHLLRFLEMPNALADWLAWIFKLWIKYQSVVSRTAFMNNLRTLRQQVIQAQKTLQDAQYTEFIGIVQAQTAITAETKRLCQSLRERGIYQRYLVHNRYQPGQELAAAPFLQTIVRVPHLSTDITSNLDPLAQIQGIARLLFE